MRRPISTGLLRVEVEHLTQQPPLQLKTAGQLEVQICATHTQTPDEHSVDLSVRVKGQTMHSRICGGAERALMDAIVRDLEA